MHRFVVKVDEIVEVFEGDFMFARFLIFVLYMSLSCDLNSIEFGDTVHLHGYIPGTRAVFCTFNDQDQMHIYSENNLAGMVLSYHLRVMHNLGSGTFLSHVLNSPEGGVQKSPAPVVRDSASQNVASS